MDVILMTMNYMRQMTSHDYELTTIKFSIEYNYT